VTFRRSSIDCCRYVKRFALLLYRLTDLRLPNYNGHSIQHAAVSQLDMNEIPSKKVPLKSASELPTDNYTKTGRKTGRIVSWCSSVIIQQQYMYLRQLSAYVS
jgi:hypothetical protein